MKKLPLYLEKPKLKVEDIDPLDRDVNCELCKLSKGARTVCMPADGDIGGLMVLGEAPTTHDDMRGRPFISGSGTFLRGEIAKHWTGPVIYDNVVRCAPGAKKISPKMKDACAPYTAAIWEEALAQRVIIVGSGAMRSFVGATTPIMSARRGYTFTASGVPVFFLLHPAVALRNRFIKTWFEDDIEWALTCPIPEKPPYDGITWMIETPEDSEEACFDLRCEDFATVDIETFGAVFDDEFRVLTVGMAGLSNVAYVWEGEAVLRNPAIIAPLKALLEDPDYSIGGQNMKFDVAGLEVGLDIHCKGVQFDSRLFRKLVQADAVSALEDMQALVGMFGGKSQMDIEIKEGIKEMRREVRKPMAEPKTRRDWDIVLAAARLKEGQDPKRFAYALPSPEVRATYCGRDCVSTSRLKAKYEPLVLNDEYLAPVWNDINLDLMHAIGRMELNGIGIDQTAVRHLQDYLEMQRVELAARLKRFDPIIEMLTADAKTQKFEFNPNSTQQVALLLFDHFQLPIRSTTDTGKPSTGAEVLDKIAEGRAGAPAPARKLCADIVAFRRVTKFKGTYADGMMTHVRDDGRIHPDIWMDGTETGRPSCKKPNLLNIPRAETPEGKMCRDVFVSEDGWELLESDFSQIEVRKGAELSGDAKMIKIFASGRDFHLETAKMIAPLFGVDPDIVDKEHPMRSRAKTVNFNILYDQTDGAAAGLAKKLGTNRKVAQKLMDAILGEYTDLKKWCTEQVRFARKHGYVHTYWKGKPARTRPLYKIMDASEGVRMNAERSSYNTPVQGSAAEHTNRALGELQRWIDKVKAPTKLVLTVYDSIIQEVRADALKEIARETIKIMRRHETTVPFLVDQKKGKAWGSLIHYEAA